MDELIFKTLSEIVNEQHRTAAIFEKYNLDYCCKGRRTLEQACNENNVPIAQITGALETIYTGKNDGPDFTKMKPGQLTEYIVNVHHSYVKKEMPQILSYLEKVSSKHGGRHPELYKIAELFVEFSNEMAHHMHDEETIVFPLIKRLGQRGSEPFSDGREYPENFELSIINMKHEHEDAGKIMAGIRRLTNNYTPPVNACTTFRLLYSSLEAFEIDLHKHVHLENSILFHKALLLQKVSDTHFLNN